MCVWASARIHNEFIIDIAVAAGGFGTITDSWVRDKSPENCLNSVEIYDPEANSWTQGPDLPAPLCAMGVVKYYGTIYVLGAYTCTRPPFDVVGVVADVVTVSRARDLT